MNDEQIPDWAKTWYYDKGFAEAEEFWRFEERERIIKLLDECVCGASVEKCMTCECNERKIKRVDLIALIRGEK